MKTVAAIGVTILLSVLASDAGADVRTNASTPAQKDVLLVVGPLDSDNTQARATVLGQKLPVSVPSPGYTNFVYGRIGSDGSVSVSSIRQSGLYVPGSTAVFLMGIVQKSDPALARITIGTVTVDLTSALAGLPSALPPVGATVQIKGTQPVMGGLVLANEIRIGSQIAVSDLSTTMNLAIASGPVNTVTTVVAGTVSGSVGDVSHGGSGSIGGVSHGSSGIVGSGHGGAGEPHIQ